MEDEEKEYITKEELERELSEKNSSLPRRHGGLALLLGAVLLVAAGAMTGYYYYLFQKQQGGSSQVLRRVWEEVILATNRLTNHLDKVDNYSDFLLIKDDLNKTQRQIRDARYNLPNLASPSAPLAQSRLVAFLDDYADALVALDQLLAEGETISSKAKLDPAKMAFESLGESYDELLLAGRSFIKSSLPRNFLKLPITLDTLLTQFLAEEGQHQAEEETITSLVNDFMQAFISKEEEELKKSLTEKARQAFNPGVLEDTREFSDFSIISREKKDDVYSVQGQLKVRTPDGLTTTETWEFQAQKAGDQWLIGKWGKV